MLLGVADPFSLGVADPFMLAPTSGDRFFGGLVPLVFLEFLVFLEILVPLVFLELLVFLAQLRSPLTSNV